MKKLNALYVSLAALVLAVVALVMNIVCCASGEKADVEAALMAKPEMVINAMQAYEVQQREEAMKKAEENIKANADELYNRAGDGILGNPEGKIVLVEFFDYSCGFCGKLYPALKEVIANNPDLKVVAKPMAFLSPASKYAAEASLAAAEQGKFAEVYSAIFETEGRLNEEKINAALTKVGVDMEKVKADMKSQKVQDTLRSVSELAGKIQVNGVPTLVLNNKVLQTLDAATIQRALDEAK
ncbi:MAG: hypothetical protein E7004_05050 [Alphaproteobacteria bacterium]|nr:hypothetical protein [Alphaproteobacteria bacterium]